MDNGTMLGELIAELSVLNRLIGHEAALAGDADDGKHAVHLDGFDSERASRAIALNQGQNGILVRRTLVELHIPRTFRHSRRPILDRRWAQANRRTWRYWNACCLRHRVANCSAISSMILAPSIEPATLGEFISEP
jgi:hypothetical protein